MAGMYFDCNATTPLDEDVLHAMVSAARAFGNPSSPHRFGFEAKAMVEEARRHAAALIGAKPTEIVFTSSGSEANNLAIKGWLYQFHRCPGHIITSAIEHPSVLYVCRHLEQAGFTVTYLPVDRYGFVSPDEIRRALRPDTQLITIMLANNEIGTIQPIRDIAAIAKSRGVFVHTDAVQAVGKIRVDVNELGVDALSFSAHKFYGPKGVGALYVRTGACLEPLVHGGGQEQGLRSGTENVPGIIGFGKACQLAAARLDESIATCSRLKEMLLFRLRQYLGDWCVNGSVDPHRTLPNTVNIGFTGIRGDALAAQLSEVYGIAVSVGSACGTRKAALSHVLQALRLPEETIKASIRISWGRHTTEHDINTLVHALKEVVTRLRCLSPY